MPFNEHLFDTLFIDSVKARLADPRDKCAGHVSLFYAGKWTPICQDSLDTNLKNAICKELLCGRSINDQHDWTSHEETKIPGLSRIKCLDSANSVSKCDLNDVSEKQCIVGYLKCTGTYLFYFCDLKTFLKEIFVISTKFSLDCSLICILLRTKSTNTLAKVS